MSASVCPVRELRETSVPTWPGPRAATLDLKQCAHAIRERLHHIHSFEGPRQPAEHWLVGNHSFLHCQIREALRDLKPARMRELLRAGAVAGEPRIYRIAVSQVRKLDAGAIDITALPAEITSQRDLTLRELWAYAPLLKLALLKRLCADLESDENISECIHGLHALEHASWRDFVESASAVEEVLRRDPAGVHALADFETRDLARHAVEKLAERSKLTELEVAEAALRLAQTASTREGPEHIKAHIGYYLIGRGASDFARFIQCPWSLRSAAGSVIERWPGPIYGLAASLIVTLIIAAFDHLAGPLSYWGFVLLLVPASEAALEIVNSAVSHWRKPRALASMDFSRGIPDSCQTMVAVPALLLSPRTAVKLIEDLEIRYLANRDPSLLFALLTDFPDASQQTTHADSVLEICVEGIRRLNHRYSAGGPGPFCLFHRARMWNRSESKWMGHERKRGKLDDLNKLLLGGEKAFHTVIGDRARFSAIRYIITLDADTQLPRDTAAKLVACIAHPLNQPTVDPATGVVTQGYGLIRPSVSVSMESAGRTIFSHIFSGMAGFDPYATAISDVYQDLFGLTSFTGKGIYDLRSFDAALGHRFPDNAILSHDLIEGEHVRTGFLSTVELVEDYPASYEAFSKRKHRWTRGDWQLLPWLLSRPALLAPGAKKNPLGLLSRWKLADNLRRSLVEITFLFLLLSGWTSPRLSLRWTLAVLALALAPAYCDVLFSALGNVSRLVRQPFAQDLSTRLLRRHRDTLLNLIFLPHQACLMADAIVRTLVRRLFTRRNLLEWETMAQAQAGGAKAVGTVGIYLYLSCAAALLLLLLSGSANLVVRVTLLLWAMAPLVSWWLDGAPPRPAPLSAADRTFLRETALRTWRFFADHSNAEHNWLVPDNVQQDPPLAARRISPTNLGLLLTAQMASRDFGYTTLSELAVSLQRIFGSMDNMPRYRGHFFNWHDTHSLQPVGRPYLSSVDSGNLAASLSVLRQGVLSLKNQPVLGEHALAGLRDHALLLRDQLPTSMRSISIMRATSSLLRHLECQPADLFFWEETLTEAGALMDRIQDSLHHAYARPEDSRKDDKWREVKYWDHLLAQRIQSLLAELYALAPWLSPEFESELRVNGRSPHLQPLMQGLNKVPTLAELPEHYEYLRECLIELLVNPENLYPGLRATLWSLLQRLPEAESAALELIERLEDAAVQSSRYFEEMDFAFLFDDQRKLLRVGYDVHSGADDACYDLLASEARTALFLGIAKGHIPREAWFRLGRKLTAYRNHRTLISWSGTMFEYLMPLLYFRSHPNTVLDRGIRGAVRIQQGYAREHHVPWGISEAAYSARDAEMQYQYRAFGVPSLSACPDRSNGLVVAPYASMLALMVDPSRATANLRWLASLGCTGRYGFFESLDYSAARDGSPEVIRCFMAHHQGMGLLALDNVLLEGRVQALFHADQMVKATEFLLEERMPAAVEITHEDEELPAVRRNGLLAAALRARRGVLGGSSRLGARRRAEAG